VANDLGSVLSLVALLSMFAMGLSARRWYVALFLVLGASATASAQTALRGRVVDPSGAAVARASITVQGPAGEQTVVTGPQGEFVINDAAPGEYVVIAEAPGFSATGLSVTVASRRSVWIELPLQVRAVSETVQVVPGSIAGTSDRLASIPGSVDIIDRTTLDRANVFTANEALRKAPGIYARDEEGLGLRPNIGIRGTNPTRSTRVLLLEDGVPLTYAPYGDNASYYHPPIDRFESIEILKGSGQIAYGPMTVGGVINYITPQPPSTPRGVVTLAAGNRDYLNGQATFGSTTGKVGYLLDYMRKQSDGARENIFSAINDVNGKTVVRISAAQTLTLRGNYFSENSNITYSGLREGEWHANPRGNAFRNDVFDVERVGASASHLWALRDSLAFTTTFYTSGFRRDWWRQSSNSAQRPNDSADPACAGMVNLNTTCGNEGRLRSYFTVGVEPRFHAVHSVFERTVESDFGVRLHHEEQERIQKNGDSPTARDGAIVENNQRLSTAFSTFVQQRWGFGAWNVSPGLRLERVAYARTNRLRHVRGSTVVTALIPGIGVSRALGQKVTWFAGVHRGFAPPRTEDVINNNTGEVVELDPELSWNVEVGARSEIRPGVKFDATFFRMDYENQVVPSSVAGGVGATLTNGGETLHQGIEGSVRLDTAPLFGLSPNLYVRGAFTYLPVARFEGTRFSSVPGFQTVAVGGNRLPYAPAHLLTVTVGYALTDRFDALVEAVRVSEQCGDDLNTVDGTPDGQRGLLPGHVTWNAAANYRLPVYDATLFVTVKNVFDALYIADRSRGLLPGPPRLIQAGLKLRF